MSRKQNDPPSLQRMQIRCSVDAAMTDLFGPLSELPPALRGRELVAAARIGWVLRSGRDAAAALMAAIARESISPAPQRPVVEVSAAAQAALNATPAESSTPAREPADLSLAAAQQAASTFDPAFFSSAPSLQ